MRRGAVRYVLDTHFFVDVLRGGPGEDAVLRFLGSNVDDVDFHALVGAELLLGAVTPGAVDDVHQRVLGRFKPARLLVPDQGDLLAAGDALRRLRELDGEHPEHRQRNFWNDVIVAVTCRRRGRALVTHDADHARIARVVKHRVLKALPF